MEIPVKNGNSKIIIPVVIAALVVITAIGLYTYNSSNSNQPQQEILITTAPVESAVSSLAYKDGSYSASGNYVSPGGPREIDLTVTLSGDTITDVVFVGKATDPTSKRFQGEFADGYKAMIVGKNIDEVVLTKVSGSSLTPKGFNDALGKIKAEAKS